MCWARNSHNEGIDIRVIKPEFLVEDITILFEICLKINDLLTSCIDLIIEFTYIRIKSHHITHQTLNVLLHLSIAIYYLLILAG